MKKILIMTDEMPWGHRSIAKAIYSYLHSREADLKIHVDYVQVRAEIKFLINAYVFFCRYFPALGGKIIKLIGKVPYKSIVGKNAKKSNKGVREALLKYKPDVVISSYHLHSYCLVDIRKTDNLKFKIYSVATDPIRINPILFMDGADLHLVYDENAKEEAMKFGVKEKNILVTGWWVREEMYKKYPKVTNKRPVIFVGGGSLGSSAIKKVLPMILLLKKPVKFIFNCATDKVAFHMVDKYKKMLDRSKKNNIEIENRGWIEDMAKVLNGCDLVLGKAGPNFLFDCVAMRKPFVAIEHVGGQEDGNLHLIAEKKLGWVRETNIGLFRFIKKFLNHPEKYKKMFAETIDLEAEKNKKTMEKIAGIL